MIWIRSQDKEILLETNLVFFEEFNGKFEIKKWFGDSLILGTYSTKEKALKVLDMIQNKLLSSSYTLTANGHPVMLKEIYQMPQDDEV